VSVYSMRGIGTYPEVMMSSVKSSRMGRSGWSSAPILLMREGKMTFLTSLNKSGLNFSEPSESNNKSRVRRAQSSPKRLLS